MKKLLFLAVILMATTNVFAQREAGSFSIQPRIGFSAADFDCTADTKARVGLVAGVEYEYMMTNKLAFAAGLNYSQQGAEMKATDYTWKLDYLTIPLTANYYVWKGLALKAGLQPGIKVNAKLDGKNVNADLENVKSFDLAIPVGLSYDFNGFVIDARYNLGLLEIAKDSDIKNLAFQLTFGYKFTL
ncbi:MAG: PorT family protein [Prevotella sp.]|nr:PorT family protein [Prevotella sp.]